MLGVKGRYSLQKQLVESGGAFFCDGEDRTGQFLPYACVFIPTVTSNLNLRKRY